LAKDTTQQREQTDTDTDRYPDLREAIQRFLQSDNVPEGSVERVELTFLANGEGNCRIWAARAEEPDSVFLPDPNV
jgi:hypothetical protein